MGRRLYANSLSPFVRKVRIVLYEKAVDFDTVEIDRSAQRAELLRINPRGEVPALVDGSIVVSGSSAICDYLEETWPHPALLPAGAAERVRCRSLESIADTHTDVLQFLSFLLTMRRPELRADYPAAPVMLSASVKQHYLWLDRELAGTDYLTGAFSRADVAFLPHLTSLEHLGEPIPESCPSLRRWLDRMLRRPSVQRDAAHALAAWHARATNPDPFFATDRIHWRGERLEGALRLGLAPWLAREIEAGRAYFSPAPDAGS
jgi:glutathione S-transferase